MSSLITPSLVARLNTLIGAENRKRKKALFLVSKEELLAQLNKIEFLTKVNMVYTVPDLHVHLVNHINPFYDIIKVLTDEDKKAKLGKHTLNEWQNSWEELNKWWETYREEIEETFEENWLAIRYHDLFDLPSYAYRSCDNYFNHLLSKTVDYYPKGMSLNPLADMVNVFVENQSRLEDFIELGFHYWVYVFTENVRYVPYTFKQLNGANGLGQQIKKWVQVNNPDPVIELLNEAGYGQVFAGWGGLKLDNMSTTINITAGEGENETILMVPDRKEKTQKWYTPPNKEWHNKAVNYLKATMLSYIDNPQTNPTNLRHATMVMRAIATTLMYLTGGYPLKRGDLMQVFNGLRSTFKKYEGFSRRKDRKHWFIETWVNPTNVAISEMVSQVNAVPSLIIQQAFYHSILPMKYRLANEKEKLIYYTQAVDKLVEFLDNSYNEIYYSKDFIYDEEALGNILVLYTSFLEPRYQEMTPDDMKYSYLATLDYWLDIYNPRRIGVLVDAIRNHFIKRHTIEENEMFTKEVMNHVKLIPYKSKDLFKEKIEQLITEVPKWGKSHDFLHEILRLNASEKARLSTRLPSKYEIETRDVNDGSGEYTYYINGQDMHDIYSRINEKAKTYSGRDTFRVKDVTL